MSEFEEHRKKAQERLERQEKLERLEHRRPHASHHTESHKAHSHHRKRRRSDLSYFLESDRNFYIFLFGIILCGILLAALTSLAVPTKEELQKKAEAEKAAAESQFTPSKATWTAAGDVVFHGPIMESATYYNSEDNTYNYDPIFDYCRDLIEASDMATVTLETSLAGEEAGYSSYPIFRSPDALADSLAGCGFDMINLASNHVYDGGDEGLLRTMDVLKERNLGYLGTRSDEEQKTYNVVDVNGIKIGVISYVFETTEEDGEVSINSIPLSEEVAPLINSFNYNGLDSFYAEVENSLAAMKKEGAQYTIAYMHWGNEYQTTPSEQQETIAQELCDLGIDTLIGSHPHVIQPVDVLTSTDGKHQMLCAYAIGNFLSNQQIEYMTEELPTGETEDSYLLSLSLSSNKKGKVTLEDVTFTPMWTHRYPGEKDAAFLVLPVDDTKNLEDVTGVTGIKEEADESAARTQAIIGEGVEKVKEALPLKSAL